MESFLFTGLVVGTIALIYLTGWIFYSLWVRREKFKELFRGHQYYYGRFQFLVDHKVYGDCAEAYILYLIDLKLGPRKIIRLAKKAYSNYLNYFMKEIISALYDGKVGFNG